MPDDLLANLARRNAKIATSGSIATGQQQCPEVNVRNVQRAAIILTLAAPTSHSATSARVATGLCVEPTSVRHVLLGVTACVPAQSSVSMAALHVAMAVFPPWAVALQFLLDTGQKWLHAPKDLVLVAVLQASRGVQRALQARFCPLQAERPYRHANRAHSAPGRLQVPCAARSANLVRTAAQYQRHQTCTAKPALLATTRLRQDPARALSVSPVAGTMAMR